MMWDDEVDVVCCDAGFGALASAIVAVDAGLEVFVARPDRRANPESPATWREVGDRETREYFEALTADVNPNVRSGPETAIAVRALSDLTPVQPASPVEPFYGARLRDWTAQCLASPYGLLYTRVSDRGTTPMKTGTGAQIEVKSVGALGTDGGVSLVSAVNEWLLTQASHRDIRPDGATLQRIVFEEGEVVGAVIDRADGPLAVRARHGVALSIGTPIESTGHDPTPADTNYLGDQGLPLQVCLGGHSASRFCRVELLAAEPTKSLSRAASCNSNQVREGLREASRSHARRG